MNNDVFTNRTGLNPLTQLLSILLVLVFSFHTQGADTNQRTQNDDALLNQFIRSQGEGIIVFDASNIKQFWIENFVSSQNGLINIQCSSFQNRPLKIQLANINEAQDCIVDVITITDNVSFSVLNER